MTLKALDSTSSAVSGCNGLCGGGENWRERERAQTLLLLAHGMSRKDVAEELGLHVRTVGSTRSAWLAGGLDALGDLPRSGAPRKLRPEHVERIVEWAVAEPLTGSLRATTTRARRFTSTPWWARSRMQAWCGSGRGTL